MPDLVNWHGKLVPRWLVTLSPVEFVPVTCRVCGGLGEIPETIDEENFDVMVPCYACGSKVNQCESSG